MTPRSMIIHIIPIQVLRCLLASVFRSEVLHTPQLRDSCLHLTRPASWSDRCVYLSFTLPYAINMNLGW